MDPNVIPTRIEVLRSRGEVSPWTGAGAEARAVAQGRVEAARQVGAFDRGTDGYVVRDVSVGPTCATLLAVADGNYKHEPTAFAWVRRPWRCTRHSTSLSSPPQTWSRALRRAMHDAHDGIRSIQDRRAAAPLDSFFTAKTTSLKGVGASVTVALVLAPDVWVAHLGDTSAWLVEGETFRRLTLDHTLAHDPEFRSRPTADHDALRGEDVVLRVLGMDYAHRFDVPRTQVEVGDRVVLGTHVLRAVLPLSPTSDVAELSRRGAELFSDHVGATTCSLVVAPSLALAGRCVSGDTRRQAWWRRESPRSSGTSRAFALGMGDFFRRTAKLCLALGCAGLMLGSCLPGPARDRARAALEAQPSISGDPGEPLGERRARDEEETRAPSDVPSRDLPPSTPEESDPRVVDEPAPAAAQIRPSRPMRRAEARLLTPNGPLHPRCVAEVTEVDAIDITECSAVIGSTSLEAGAVTFYPAVDPEYADGREVEQYQVLGRVGDGVALRFMLNGGGTGYETGVMVVALHDRQLTRLAIFAQGDRCNGGLVEATVERGNTVRYRIELTPADVLTLTARGRALSLAAYEDLEASANSCVATATYRWRDARSELIDATLSERELEDRPGWTDQYTHQACFNALVNERIRAGARELRIADIDGLAQSFRARCVAAR